MNNDLISSESLLKDIDEVIEQYSYEKDGAAVMDALTCVRDMVSYMPAYDTDKVVEQLKKEVWSLGSDDVIEHYCVDLVDAIEIVKGGQI